MIANSQVPTRFFLFSARDERQNFEKKDPADVSYQLFRENFLTFPRLTWNHSDSGLVWKVLSCCGEAGIAAFAVSPLRQGKLSVWEKLKI